MKGVNNERWPSVSEDGYGFLTEKKKDLSTINGNLKYCIVNFKRLFFKILTLLA